MSLTPPLPKTIDFGVPVQQVADIAHNKKEHLHRCSSGAEDAT